MLISLSNKNWYSRQERFNEIVKKNQENIQKILSSNDPLLAHESTDSERQNEDIIEKLKASFQGGFTFDQNLMLMEEILFVFSKNWQVHPKILVALINT